jgi:hypothetical protein
MTAQQRPELADQNLDRPDHLVRQNIILEVSDATNRLRSAILTASMRADMPVLTFQNRPVRMNHKRIGHPAETLDTDLGDPTSIPNRIRRSFGHRMMQPDAPRLLHSRT